VGLLGACSAQIDKRWPIGLRHDASSALSAPTSTILELLEAHLTRAYLMSEQPAPIAYVAQTFPALTQTFVYRETLALQDRGFNIVTCAIWRPDKGNLPQESRHLVDRSFYVFPISWLKFLKAHLNVFLTRPGKYIGTLLFVLTRKGESYRHRLRSCYHFLEAIYLAPELRKRQVRHIHAHFTINAATIALVLSRVLGITFSFTAHNIFFTDRLLLKEKVRAARFIVAISEFTKQFLTGLVVAEHFGHKIHVVHCGLSPDDFAPADPKPQGGVPLLLFVAQLTERKGAPVLIEACRLLAERGVAFRCVVVGDGPQKPLVEQLVKRYALQQVVELIGSLHQEDVKSYLERADVFVLPCVTASNGDMDGIPVSLMEAMAMEIPTVSTYVSGIPELIENEESGLLVNEKDEVALANALQRLLEDQALCAKLGKNGRHKVIQEFNIHKSASQLATLYLRHLA
jgi:colanic acid/amylovoran biosynthesis glycosyltransferase